jgi:hypothetical protein
MLVEFDREMVALRVEMGLVGTDGGCRGWKGRQWILVLGSNTNLQVTILRQCSSVWVLHSYLIALNVVSVKLDAGACSKEMTSQGEHACPAGWLHRMRNLI